MQKTLRLTTLLVLIFAFLTPCFGKTPEIFIKPSSGLAGEKVRVEGTGFGVDEKGIKVTYDGVVVASGISADSQGKWSVRFKVPEGAVGRHNVDARGKTTKSREVADVSFEVLSSITVTDGLGRRITIKEIPKRIISLAPPITEIVFKLDLEDKLVGVTNYCNYPPEARFKEKVGGTTFADLDLEKIISLKPDLILVSTGYQKKTISAIEERGINIFALEANSLEEVIENIELVGRITGRENKAAKISDNMRKRIKAVEKKTNHFSEDKRPRVLHVTSVSEGLWTPGKGTFQDDIIRKAGGINIAHDLGKGWGIMSLEEVIHRDPEVIVVSFAHGRGLRDYKWVKTDPRLKNVTARKQGRIYKIDADIISRSGPRIVDGLEKYARFIHPKIFGEPGQIKK